MLKRILIGITGLLIFGAGCKSSGKWTGFYYENATAKQESVSVILKTPNYHSSFNQFNSLNDCTKWAYDLRKSKNKKPGDAEDLFYCARFCITDGKGISCNDPEGMVSLFTLVK